VDERLRAADAELKAASAAIGALTEKAVRSELGPVGRDVRELKLAVTAVQAAQGEAKAEIDAVRQIACAPREDPACAELRAATDAAAERAAVLARDLAQCRRTCGELSAEFAAMKGDIRGEIKTAVQQWGATARDEILRRCAEQIAKCGGAGAAPGETEELRKEIDALVKKWRGLRSEVEPICEERMTRMRTEMEMVVEAVKRDAGALRAYVDDRLQKNGGKAPPGEDRRTVDRGEIYPRGAEAALLRAEAQKTTDEIRSEMASTRRDLVQQIGECQRQCDSIKAGQDREFKSLRLEIQALKPTAAPPPLPRRRTGAF
jgi:predicted transcriptional regulator